LGKEESFEGEIIKAIKVRIKKEAGDLECLVVLQKRNPELARLCEDIDNIIVNIAYQYIQRSFQKAREKKRKSNTLAKI